MLKQFYLDSRRKCYVNIYFCYKIKFIRYILSGQEMQVKRGMFKDTPYIIIILFINFLTFFDKYDG